MFYDDITKAIVIDPLNIGCLKSYHPMFKLTMRMIFNNDYVGMVLKLIG